MKTRIIKDVEHTLYEDMAEFRAEHPETPVVYWRDGREEGQWVKLDDGGIAQIIRTGSLKGSGKAKDTHWIQTICGMFNLATRAPQDSSFQHIYNFSGVAQPKDAHERLTDRERQWVIKVVKGIDPVTAYIDTWDTTNHDYARQRVYNKFSQKRIQKVIDRELEKLMDDLEITDSWLLGQYKEIVDNQDVMDKDKLKALKDLAKIKGLFGATNETRQTLLMSGGFNPKQLAQGVKSWGQQLEEAQMIEQEEDVTNGD